MPWSGCTPNAIAGAGPNSSATARTSGAIPHTTHQASKKKTDPSDRSASAWQRQCAPGRPTDSVTISTFGSWNPGASRPSSLPNLNVWAHKYGPTAAGAPPPSRCGAGTSRDSSCGPRKPGATRRGITTRRPFTRWSGCARAMKAPCRPWVGRPAATASMTTDTCRCWRTGFLPTPNRSWPRRRAAGGIADPHHHRTGQG